MNLMPLDRLGARETSPGVIQFGVFLPWVSANDGNRLFVKVIHEHDQFLQDIQPLSFELAHSVDPAYGDYWSVQINLTTTPPPAGSSWGQPGTYVYRYELHNPNVGVLDWLVDPFAREFGTGKLSAFTLGYQDHTWSTGEANWRTPAVSDLVVYELQLDEFAAGIAEAINRLEYLADLGVNCIEIMPVSNVSMQMDWGFLPIGYFGVDERFGNRSDLQWLVDSAHQLGIAVVLDVVYGHTGDDFPYCDLYRRLRYRDNPFLGAFAKDLFGESTDFTKTFAQDFFFSVSYLWLDRFHVDGFRYDCVPNYWDGPTGVGYANLVYSTYALAQNQVAAGQWLRFSSGNRLNLIQCAEQLEDPIGVLYQSYSNATWQNGTFDAAKAVAGGDRGSLYQLGLRLGLDGYPAEVAHNGATIATTAFQYIENHDHERFVCNFGLHSQGEPLLQEGDRSNWFKVQPYLIGMLMARGTPMLWQGQELGENYWIPPGGVGRVMLLRPVRWDYFYDETGRATIRLVRALIRIRRAYSEFRIGDHYFHNDWGLYQSRGVLLFSRSTADAYSLVALNTGDSDQTVSFWFPRSGDYPELLHGNPEDVRNGVTANTEVRLTIPRNYGRIWRTG